MTTPGESSPPAAEEHGQKLLVIAVVLPAASNRQQHKIDYLGATTLAAFATAVVLATSWGGTTYAWSSPVIIALSYLPLFLQVVHGVSPTISGVYLLPMVLGLLITSIGSGQIIARTGRYKVFPIIGSAVLAVALYLSPRWMRPP